MDVIDVQQYAHKIIATIGIVGLLAIGVVAVAAATEQPAIVGVEPIYTYGKSGAHTYSIYSFDDGTRCKVWHGDRALRPTGGSTPYCK